MYIYETSGRRLKWTRLVSSNGPRSYLQRQPLRLPMIILFRGALIIVFSRNSIPMSNSSKKRLETAFSNSRRVFLENLGELQGHQHCGDRQDRWQEAEAPPGHQRLQIPVTSNSASDDDLSVLLCYIQENKLSLRKLIQDSRII